MELTRRFAESVANARYETIPDAALRSAKMGILDTIGVMVPPARLDQTSANLFDLVAEEGLTGECTLIGVNAKSSALMAAYLNGSFAHVLDYDDTVDTMGHHPSAQTVPAALAVAEKLGGISGKDFITAVAVGQDVGVRLAGAPRGKLGHDHHWFPISNFGVFAATSAAGRVLGLGEEQMVNALGLALHRCHGQLGAVTAPESELRAIRDGFINKEGVLCALMARKGVRACHDAIERFFGSYYDDDFDRDSLTEGLGAEYRGASASLKPWPSCRVTHGYMEAVRSIISENDLALDDIEAIITDVSPGTRQLLCEPEPAKRKPTQSIQAKFSMFFAVAVAALKTPEISDFLPENLENGEVLALAQKIIHRDNDECGQIAPAIVEVCTRDGRSISRRVDAIYGHPDNPMPNAAVIAKFKDCLRFCSNPVSDQQIDQLASMLVHLEQVQDVREVSALLP